MQTKSASWIFLVAGAFFALGWSLQSWSPNQVASQIPSALDTDATAHDLWAGSVDFSSSTALPTPRDLHFTQLAAPPLTAPQNAVRSLNQLRNPSSPVQSFRGPPKVAPPIDLREFSPEEQSNIAVYEQYNRLGCEHQHQDAEPRDATLWRIDSRGAGSGSVIDMAGHILTNNHVVEGAREIEVTLADGKSYEATVVGTIRPMTWP